MAAIIFSEMQSLSGKLGLNLAPDLVTSDGGHLRAVC